MHRGGLHSNRVPGGRQRLARISFAGRVGGTFHKTLFCNTRHVQLMTPSTVYVTNLTPPRECHNPSRMYGQGHQLMTAGMVHVTNLTPGSAACNRTRRCESAPPRCFTRRRPRGCPCLSSVGRYKLNPVDPQLETTRSQPLNLSSGKTVSSLLCFQHATCSATHRPRD
jgi:hypothetical protein